MFSLTFTLFFLRIVQLHPLFLSLSLSQALVNSQERKPANLPGLCQLPDGTDTCWADTGALQAGPAAAMGA